MRDIFGTICCDVCSSEIIFNKYEINDILSCNECNTNYSVKRVHGSLIISKM